MGKIWDIPTSPGKWKIHTIDLLEYFGFTVSFMLFDDFPLLIFPNLSVTPGTFSLSALYGTSDKEWLVIEGTLWWNNQRKSISVTHRFWTCIFHSTGVGWCKIPRHDIMCLHIWMRGPSRRQQRRELSNLPQGHRNAFSDHPVIHSFCVWQVQHYRFWESWSK